MPYSIHAETRWRQNENFRSLEVWEKSHRLTLESYRATRKFPSDERFGLISQIRRAAASVPANIAEGCGRQGNGEFHRFLQTAMGSASELEYHFLLARDLEYLDAEHYKILDEETTRVKRMLASLIGRVALERQKTRSMNA